MIFTPKLNKNRMQVKFGKHTVQCLVHAGAEISAMSKPLLNQVAPNARIRPSNLSNIVGVCGEVHRVLGQVELPFQHVFQMFEHLHVSVLVGIDFMTAKNNVTVKSGVGNRGSI